MPGTFRNYVEAVRAGADIAQVVGEVVTLRRAGQSLSGLCPFHHEKTPSFSVNPAKGVYYCFGCGAGGDVFRFVMEYHHVEFAEAVGLIGDRLGIPRPAPAGRQEVEEERQRRRALEALARAAEFFSQRLADPAGEPARAYLERRGLTMATAQQFGLGYAPPGWDGLLRALGPRGVSTEDLLRAGLVVPRTNGEGYYDRFRNRLVFPIRDSAGRVVSFGGRALGDEDPKYLNGPETAIYDKSRTLYRFHDVAAEVRRDGRAIVVEGYFDAISLAAAGVPGVVAVCGTAFGPAHARLVRRLAERVVLLFDGDRAGRQAAHRALGPVLAEGLEVRVAKPPEGLDPDDLARDGGRDAVERCIATAEDLPQFLVGEASRAFDLSSGDGKVKALEAILGQLAQLKSPLARSEAVDRVAERLGIDDDLVRIELRRAARDRQREFKGRVGSRRRGETFREAESLLLRYLGGSAREAPEVADELLAGIPREALSGATRAAVEGWEDARRSGAVLDLRQLAEVVPTESAPDILALAFASGSEPDLEAARGAAAALKEGFLKVRLKRVQDEIQAAADPADHAALILQKLALAREIQGLEAGPSRSARSGDTTEGRP